MFSKEVRTKTNLHSSHCIIPSALHNLLHLPGTHYQAFLPEILKLQLNAQGSNIYAGGLLILPLIMLALQRGHYTLENAIREAPSCR